MTATTEPERPAPRAASRSARDRVLGRPGQRLGSRTAGFLVFTLESRRIQQMITEHVDQEIADWRALQRDGDRPRDRPRASPPCGRLLDTFLVRNVPDDDEMLVGYWDGRPVERTRTSSARRSWRTRRSCCSRAPACPTAGAGDADAERGAWVTVQPVATGARTGALVIVNFVDEEQDELRRVMRTYAVVVAALLGADRRRPRGSSRAGCCARCARCDDGPRHHRDRPLPAPPRDRQRRHHRPHAHRSTRMLAASSTRSRRSAQFLDDAGHELRTPLTVLRGHLELLDHDDPEDVADDPRPAARRDRPDVAAGRRPDPARQVRPSRLRRRRGPASAERSSTSVHRKARGAGRPQLGARTPRRRGAWPRSTSSGSPRRCSSCATTR